MDDYKLKCDNQKSYKEGHERVIDDCQRIIDKIGIALQIALLECNLLYKKTDIICVKEAVQGILEPHYSAAQRSLREGGYEHDEVTAE